MICAPEDHIVIHSSNRNPVPPSSSEKFPEIRKNATTGVKESPAPTTKGWSPERRAAQSARARASKPWLKSTGPRTSAGKRRCRMNGLKHGHRSEPMRLLSRLLNAQKIFVSRWRAGRYHPPRRRFPWLRNRGAECITLTARLSHQNRLGFLRYHTFSGES